MKKLICAAVLTTGLFPMAAVDADDDSWQYSLSIYGWFPDISGTTNFPLAPDESFTVPIDDILDNLEFTFQGTFDARKGNWGMFADLIYLDLGNDKKVTNGGSIGDIELPVEISGEIGIDMKSLIVTPAAYYRLVSDENKDFDMLFGLRYADVEQELDWEISGDIGSLEIPGRSGEAKVSESYWDAIVGMRGRFALGQGGNWYVPYYADVGTGDSDLTWQLMAGFGYRFGWGRIAAVYRIVEYDLPSGKPMNDMDFSGPEVGAVFHW